MIRQLVRFHSVTQLIVGGRGFLTQTCKSTETSSAKDIPPLRNGFHPPSRQRGRLQGHFQDDCGENAAYTHRLRVQRPCRFPLPAPSVALQPQSPLRVSASDRNVMWNSDINCVRRQIRWEFIMSLLKEGKKKKSGLCKLGFYLKIMPNLHTSVWAPEYFDRLSWQIMTTLLIIATPTNSADWSLNLNTNTVHSSGDNLGDWK